MLQHTQGIVIKATKYSETSLVTQIFTREYGMQGFLVQGVYRKKSAFQPSHFQHLNRLDMVVYHKPNRQLQKIKELEINPLFQSIPFHIQKTSLAIFMAEVLQKTIREEESNPGLFDFLNQIIQFLDDWEGPVANFPLFFLVRLSKFLGFFPRNNFKKENPFFNLEEGHFQKEKPGETNGILPPDSQYFSALIDQNLNAVNEPAIPLKSRQNLLNKLLDYFRFHLSEFSKVRSSYVLREVLQD